MAWIAILHITVPLKERPVMPTPLPHLLVVSRPAWVRALDTALDATRRHADSARHGWAQWQAARRRAAVRAALLQLSPHLLRDIGAPDDLLAEAVARASVAEHQRSAAWRIE
jgi:uncharacterized protein YjiS (DUF1127 family)